MQIFCPAGTKLFFPNPLLFKLVDGLKSDVACEVMLQYPTVSQL